MSTRGKPAYLLNVVPHPKCVQSTLHRLLTIYFDARKEEYSHRSSLHFQSVFLPIGWLRASTAENFSEYILTKNGLSEKNDLIWGSCRPRIFVDTILRQLGRCEQSSGYWLNALHLTCLSCLPRCLSHRLIQFWMT